MNAEKTGKLISEIRKEKGMTQSELAEELFVSDKAVSRWETGRGFPDLNILEKLAETLDISIAELLKGERIEESLSVEETKAIVKDSARAAMKHLDRNRRQAFLTGLILALIVVVTAAVHLNSPSYFTDAKDRIKIETLSDGSLAALFTEDVAGYQLEVFEGPEKEKICSIGAYTTKWYSLFGRKDHKAAVIGDVEDIDMVMAYPGSQGDVLLYSKGPAPSWGMETLPRLLYNYWLIIGGAVSLLMTLLFVVMKKKKKMRIPARAVLLPLSFTISIVVILLSNDAGIYNAGYYLSGIILLTILIFLFMDRLLDIKKMRDREKELNNNI